MNYQRQRQGKQRITRRKLFKVTGAIIFVTSIAGCGSRGADESPEATVASQATAMPPPVPTSVMGQPSALANSIPPADGYLLVDIEKCQGCASCMLACSLIHEGVESLSLARIQMMQDSFAAFPNDLTIEQCRQCVEPACVTVCPTGALAADAANGHVRRVDAETCIGCGRCYEACPYTPSRAFLTADAEYDNAAKARKCDLCADAPYHWDEAGGGPGGIQACVAICPVGAIVYSDEIPVQNGDGGYKVNLRGESWAILGYPLS